MLLFSFSSFCAELYIFLSDYITSHLWDKTDKNIVNRQLKSGKKGDGTRPANTTELSKTHVSGLSSPLSDRVPEERKRQRHEEEYDQGSRGFFDFIINIVVVVVVDDFKIRDVRESRMKLL